MCNCIHELLNVFEDSAQRERTIKSGPANAGLCHRGLQPCLVLQPYIFYYVWYSNAVLVVVNV